MSADGLTILLSGLTTLVLTLLVFSRLLGDNPAFRVAQYLFVGVSLGFAFVVVYHQVLLPAVIDSLSSLNHPLGLIIKLTPWLLGLLLLTRISGRQHWSWLANLPLALLFGVGTAMAVGGALVGTLAPQILATIRPSGSDIAQILGAVLLVIGVVLTLCYFYFTIPTHTPSGRLVMLGARIGRWLLMLAFGFFLAGGLLTYLTALNTRLEVIINWLRAPLG